MNEIFLFATCQTAAFTNQNRRSRRHNTLSNGGRKRSDELIERFDRYVKQNQQND